METFTEEKVLLRIYIGESDRHGRLPLYEALVELFRQEGLVGATVLRGIAGFGASSVFHSDKLLELSKDLPILIEAVDTREKIEELMPRIDAMMNGGMITMEAIQVRHYSKQPQ